MDWQEKEKDRIGLLFSIIEVSLTYVLNQRSTHENKVAFCVRHLALPSACGRYYELSCGQLYVASYAMC